MKARAKLIIIAKKEFKSLLNEKTLLLAILIQLFIAAFSSFLMVGLTSFFEPEALGEYNLQSAQIGVIGEGELSGELARFLDSHQLKLHYYKGNFNEAYKDFMDGSLDAILVIPDTKILEEKNKIIYLSLYLPKSDIKATLVTLQLKEPLEKFENYVREQRLQEKNIKLLKINIEEKEEKKKKKSTTNFEFIYVMLLPLLVLTPAFISGGLIIDTVTEEFERKTIDLLLVSPILLKEVLNGKMLTATLIAPLQAAAWLLLLQINGIPIQNNILILLLTGII
ncbi:MAG TPA: ABC transporter permease, partial [Methanosarcinales archaeon]|nr:ABC transporter permease [Methanosarcinales archaeon]